jgi:hypothetical protein
MISAMISYAEATCDQRQRKGRYVINVQSFQQREINIFSGRPVMNTISCVMVNKVLTPAYRR